MKHFTITSAVVAFSIAEIGAVEITSPQFPLKLSENLRYLVDQHGTPFLCHADTPWMLFTQLTETKAKDHIARRKEQEFTGELARSPQSPGRAQSEAFPQPLRIPAMVETDARLAQCRGRGGPRPRRDQ